MGIEAVMEEIMSDRLVDVLYVATACIVLLGLLFAAEAIVVWFENRRFERQAKQLYEQFKKGLR